LNRGFLSQMKRIRMSRQLRISIRAIALIRRFFKKKSAYSLVRSKGTGTLRQNLGAGLGGGAAGPYWLASAKKFPFIRGGVAAAVGCEIVSASHRAFTRKSGPRNSRTCFDFKTRVGAASFRQRPRAVGLRRGRGC